MGSPHSLPDIPTHLVWSAIPCDRPGGTVHAVEVRVLRRMFEDDNIYSCRAVCRRKIRPAVYFLGNAELCPDCRALVPELRVPAPGGILLRELRRLFPAV